MKDEQAIRLELIEVTRQLQMLTNEILSKDPTARDLFGRQQALCGVLEITPEEIEEEIRVTGAA